MSTATITGQEIGEISCPFEMCLMFGFISLRWAFGIDGIVRFFIRFAWGNRFTSQGEVDMGHGDHCYRGESK